MKILFYRLVFIILDFIVLLIIFPFIIIGNVCESIVEFSGFYFRWQNNKKKTRNET